MINIAIDGPAGSGKSTIAKILARDMNLLYLDTGAMYRAIAYYFCDKGIQPDDAKRINKMLDDIEMEIKYKDGTQRVIVNNNDVTNSIRTNEISMAASTISKNPVVRNKLVSIQREIAQKTNCVLDGRDIGSYVLPNANLKFYLTATPEVRAHRRNEELIKNGYEDNYEKVLKEMILRDYQDMNRDFAPLVVAKGAVVIDTSDLSIDEVIGAIKQYVQDYIKL